MITIPLDDKLNYAAYWAAALKRHKAMIAAGCVSPVGAIRLSSKPKEQDDESNIRNDGDGDPRTD